MHKNNDISKPTSGVFLRHFLVGGAIGIANVIPGVSGGTIAVVFGIYEDLMEALGNFLTNKEKRWEYIRFLGVLFFGAVIAIGGFARVIKWAYANHELMTVFFFMGLILGSIPIIVKSHDDMKPTLFRCLFFLLGLALVVALAILNTSGNAAAESATGMDLTNVGAGKYLYFLLAGVIASSAMIIPGISGSFILILLGVYWTVIDSVSAFTTTLFEQGLTPELAVRGFLLGAMGVGIVFGVVGFSKIISYALKHFPSITLYTILGLIIGSFYQIYPGFEFNLNGGGAVVTFSIGLFISLRFSNE